MAAYKIYRRKKFQKGFKFSSLKSYKVTQVTNVMQGFCWKFSRMVPKLQGYENYDAQTNISSRLQGYGSYKVAQGTIQ